MEDNGNKLADLPEPLPKAGVFDSFLEGLFEPIFTESQFLVTNPVIILLNCRRVLGSGKK